MMDLSSLLDLYRKTLLEDVVPFWTRHALDANGGINSCIADDGRVLSRDRWSWSQWRAVWVFSKLYTSVEPREEWLSAAKGICDFVGAHGPLEDGHWPLLLDGEGMVLRGYESIYADGFAIYALAELWRATGDERLLGLAMETFRATETALNGEEPPPAWPYPIAPGWIAHGISMILSLAYHELAEVSGDDAVRSAAVVHHERVMNTFLRRDRGLVLEYLHRDGSEIVEPQGRVVVPGHAIESMWFQMHIARELNDRAVMDRAVMDRAVMDRAVAAIRDHLELGWDDEYGGLVLAVDAQGHEAAAWPYADSKLWWPHTEALYATLLAYEHCRESWCLEWHERVRAYSFAHFPVRPHGEWRQKLDRRGRPFDDVVALPVKDPFHLPRALIYCVEVLERLCAG